jgi:hypothetical protein
MTPPVTPAMANEPDPDEHELDTRQRLDIDTRSDIKATDAPTQSIPP